MQTYTLYVGSNNETHKLEINLLQKTLDSYFDGYTITLAKGVWKGAHEKTALVEVATNQNILPIIETLKQTLKQEAIAYKLSTPLIFA